MRKSIESDVTEGETSPPARADLREGTYERKLGRAGSSGTITHIDHPNPPTAWSDPAGPLVLPWPGNLLLQNASVQMRSWRLSVPTTLLRNSDGDELLFVHEGTGELFCDCGHLSYRDGDYIVMPREAMWRLEPNGPTTLVLFEVTDGSYQLPSRAIFYWGPRPGQHPQFDPTMLDRPRIDEAFRAQRQDSAKGWLVTVKRRNQVSTTAYQFNPLDATGCKGSLVPVRINWRDIRLQAQSPLSFG